jgi:geranylgeranyl diphosphate synthase, type II
MSTLSSYAAAFESYLKSHPLSREPIHLYEPADYILSLGGKRLRPLFALMSTGAFGGDQDKAMKVAMAVEVFHNFTLLHDDIMDAADIRRGHPTVHKKYNVNTAILTGDAMMIQAYQYLLDLRDPQLIKDTMDVFNKMAIEVCEGQQLDVDFETRDDVTIEEYIHMITYKTSVLIGAASQLGAIVAGGSVSDQEHLYQYAKNFGIAFQLQDDVLDTFGEAAQVGKRIGGDILMNKKTYLYLKTLQLASQDQILRLKHLYSTSNTLADQDKIDEVISIMNSVVVREYCNQVIEAYKDLSLSHLAAASMDEHHRAELKQLVESMIYRHH